MRIASSPVYLDASALAKLYVREAESDALDDLLAGRSDLHVSHLGVTEVVSALARRVRERGLPKTVVRRVASRMLRDLDEGRYLLAETSEATHRMAERFLVSTGVRVPLRAADALHLATAAAAGARVFATFDRRLEDAATEIGGFELLGD